MTTAQRSSPITGTGASPWATASVPDKCFQHKRSGLSSFPEFQAGVLPHTEEHRSPGHYTAPETTTTQTQRREGVGAHFQEATHTVCVSYIESSTLGRSGHLWLYWVCFFRDPHIFKGLYYTVFFKMTTPNFSRSNSKFYCFLIDVWMHCRVHPIC